MALRTPGQSSNLLGRAGDTTRLLPRLIPAILALVGLVLPKVPFGYLFDVVPAPSLILIIIFFWTMIDTERLSPIFIFVLGLIEDLISGTPLGSWSLAYLLAYSFVVTQGGVLMTRSFLMQWMVFGLIGLLSYLFVYIAIGLKVGNFSPPAVLLVPYIVTLAIFPPLAKLFIKIEETLQKSGVGK